MFILVYSPTIGTLIVVPDVAQINMPGAKAETKGRQGPSCKFKFKGILSVNILVLDFGFRI